VLFQDGFFYFSPLPIPIRQLADKPASADGTVRLRRIGEYVVAKFYTKTRSKAGGFLFNNNRILTTYYDGNSKFQALISKHLRKLKKSNPKQFRNLEFVWSLVLGMVFGIWCLCLYLCPKFN